MPALSEVPRRPRKGQSRPSRSPRQTSICATEGSLQQFANNNTNKVMSPVDYKPKRKKLTKALQVAIFRRDAWLCCWCKRPVIFSPALKLLELEVKNSGVGARLAYYHAHGTREGSPLLDELGAAIDHVEAFSLGGACSEENLRTSCWKCNVRKSSAALDHWDKREKRSPVKSKYGEPQAWDGLTSVFIMLAKRNPAQLTAGEREWLKALTPNIETIPVRAEACVPPHLLENPSSTFVGHQNSRIVHPKNALEDTIAVS